MRDYLDRSIDMYWDAHAPVTAPTFGTEQEAKAWVGSQYIVLRGVCKTHGLWFEGAVGHSYNELQLQEALGTEKHKEEE